MVDPCVLCIGNFDGVHLGHRRILAQAGQMAQQRRMRVAALTFDPHPATLLRPALAPPRLMTLPLKRAALLRAGADQVDVLAPTPELLSHTPEQFVREVVEQYHPAAFVEGPDFRFGKGRSGDVRTLAQLGRQFNYAVHVVEPVQVALSDQLLTTVSSSMIRWLLARGRVADAALCLGDLYCVVGTVAAGDKQGRKLGVPTANLPVDALEQLPPADGVYAGLVRVQGESPEYAAAISVGAKPTFAGRRRLIEAHCLNFDGDLYGKVLEVRFSRWLRDQQPFPGLPALTAQLQRDIERTRRWHDAGLLQPPQPQPADQASNRSHEL